MTLLVLGSMSCRWTPPETAVRIGDESIPIGELECPDLLPENSDQCRELSRMKMRRILFDRMLDRAAELTGARLSPQDEDQVEGLIERIGPMHERYETAMDCHAMAALARLGEDVQPDPDCRVDPSQVDQLVASLSRRELNEIIEEDIQAELEARQRVNLRAELLLRRVRADLQDEGRDEEEFWREVYESIDPVFYDADLRMGPAEVITGNPLGWLS